MFQFDFDIDADERSIARSPSNSVDTGAKDGPRNALDSSVEVPLSDLLQSLPTELSYSILTIKEGIHIPRRDFHDARLAMLSSTDAAFDTIDTIFSEGSDLVPGKYEGGMKTWECALDLVEYLDGIREELRGKTSVLEIGCGTSIPTLYLLSSLFNSTEGATSRTIRVCLQDYNRAVLELMTLPNIFLVWYLSPAADPHRIRPPRDAPETTVSLSPSLFSAFLSSLSSLGIVLSFYCGSWSSFHPFPPFDIVLTSETIYRPSTLPDLVHLLKEASAEDAICLVAAKLVYFGVGGSVGEFENAAKAVGLRPCTVWSATEGLRRCISRVRKG